MPGLCGTEKARLLRLLRKLARARRGSRRRGRVQAAIAKLTAGQADRRKDWVEETSTGLARGFDVIAVEDLKIRTMTRSARGTVDVQGRSVGQKAGLKRGILVAGWGRLVARLEHKAPGRAVTINPACTSGGARRAGSRTGRRARAKRVCGARSRGVRRQRRCERGQEHRTRGRACRRCAGRAT
ncbi:hypothetical protein ACTWPW_64495, partial [Nonomuraea sp. KM90]